MPTEPSSFPGKPVPSMSPCLPYHRDNPTARLPSS